MPTIPLSYRKPLLVAVVASVVGFLSMGATGMLVFTAADWLVDLAIAVPRGWARPHGDTVWPTAIMYALATPWVALAVFVGIRQRLHTRASRVLAITGICALVMLAVHLAYRANAR
jgi:hypothetical protein